MAEYIWQQSDWRKKLRWDEAALLAPLARARRLQGELLGAARTLGFDVALAAQAEALAEEALKTAAIEGESYDREAVRSSVALHLGLPTAGLKPASRDADGLVRVLIDATRKCETPLTSERLYGYHAALFSTGYSGFTPNEVGKWRTSAEPMRIVSGPVGRETVHYVAPPAASVPLEMAEFFDWWNGKGEVDGLLRAALAHFQFVAIHPFDDGNGRLARALAESQLARDEGGTLRFYSLSARIMAERADYYRVLNAASAGDGELTEYLAWFLGCLARAIEDAGGALANVLKKAAYWRERQGAELNARQAKALNRLLDAGQGGFEGGLTTRKYMAITKTSRATAQRELADLLARGFLTKRPGGGRSTSYEPAW